MTPNLELDDLDIISPTRDQYTHIGRFDQEADRNRTSHPLQAFWN